MSNWIVLVLSLVLLILAFLAGRAGRKQSDKRIQNLVRALERICFRGCFTDDVAPPFRCRPMTSDDAAKIAKEALNKDAELEMGEGRQ